VNRFLLENADLLESASANEPVSVTVPVGAHSVDIGSNAQLSLLEKPRFEQAKASSNNTNQIQLNNIAAYVQDVELKATSDLPDKASSSLPQFPLIHDKIPPVSPRLKPVDSVHMKLPLIPSNVMPPPFQSAPLQGPPPKLQMYEPVAQVLNIPLNPIYMPKRQHPLPPTTSSLLNPFGSLKLLNGMKNPLIPQMLSNYLSKNRRLQYVPNDNFEFVNRYSPNGQRLYRNKRYVHDKQGEVGLKRGFQVVTSLDLSFSPNMSADQMPVYEGIPAPIVYGLCFSTSHVYFFLGLAALLLVVVASCVYIICRLEGAKKEWF